VGLHTLTLHLSAQHRNLTDKFVWSCSVRLPLLWVMREVIGRQPTLNFFFGEADSRLELMTFFTHLHFKSSNHSQTTHNERDSHSQKKIEWRRKRKRTLVYLYFFFFHSCFEMEEGMGIYTTPYNLNFHHKFT
jgi:hypothetical protein